MKVGARIEEADREAGRARESRGLSLEDVEERRNLYGLNLLPAPPRLSLWRRLLLQLVHFFAVMLWIAGALAILAGMPQLGFAIFVVILLNGLFAFLQEFQRLCLKTNLSAALGARKVPIVN
jgi:magnesium-transporting ATPase (P-type)